MESWGGVRGVACVCSVIGTQRKQRAESNIENVKFSVAGVQLERRGGVTLGRRGMNWRPRCPWQHPGRGGRERGDSGEARKGEGGNSSTQNPQHACSSTPPRPTRVGDAPPSVRFAYALAWPFPVKPSNSSPALTT